MLRVQGSEALVVLDDAQSAHQGYGEEGEEETHTINVSHITEIQGDSVAHTSINTFTGISIIDASLPLSLLLFGALAV